MITHNNSSRLTAMADVYVATSLNINLLKGVYVSITIFSKICT